MNDFSTPFQFSDILTSAVLVDYLMSEITLYIKRNIHYYYLMPNLFIYDFIKKLTFFSRIKQSLF